MARPASKHPTELELEILKVLWRDGPASVRQVRDALSPTRDLAYTSVMTIMTIMARKKYLKRRKEGAGYVYSTAISEEDTAGGMLRDIVDRVFDGSTQALVVNLLQADNLDPEELKRLRRTINRRIKEQTS